MDAPTVFISGVPATVSPSTAGTTFTATAVVVNTMQEGFATLVINDYADEFGFSGGEITSTTDGSRVSIGNAPTLGVSLS